MQNKWGSDAVSDIAPGQERGCFRTPSEGFGSRCQTLAIPNSFHIAHCVLARIMLLTYNNNNNTNNNHPIKLMLGVFFGIKSNK